MNNQTISRGAMVVFAIIIAVFGVYHFIHPDNLAIIVPYFIPGSVVWVYMVGAVLILAAMAFILNRFVKLAGYTLAIMMLAFALFIHLPGFMNSGDKELQTLSFMNFLKDIGLACCSVLIATREYAEND